jgi:glycosyl transferase, family 25
MKVFVINLARSADRRTRMKQSLDSLGVPFEFFAGTDGKELKKHEIESAYDENGVIRNINRTLSINEIGCTISHRSLYKKIADEHIDKACILEDDVLLDQAFPKILEALDGKKLKNTVIKLDNYQEKNTPCSLWRRKALGGGYRLKKPVTTQWMAWGYVMDKEAASNILEAWPKIEFMSDDWKRMSKAVRIGCVQPSVVHQNASLESVIDEDRKDLLSKLNRPDPKPFRFSRLIHIAKTLIKMLFP